MHHLLHPDVMRFIWQILLITLSFEISFVSAFCFHQVWFVWFGRSTLKIYNLLFPFSVHQVFHPMWCVWSGRACLNICLSVYHYNIHWQCISFFYNCLMHISLTFVLVHHVFHIVWYVSFVLVLVHNLFACCLQTSPLSFLFADHTCYWYLVELMLHWTNSFVEKKVSDLSLNPSHSLWARIHWYISSVRLSLFYLS